ncbi:MAG: hypothetical protein FJ147_27180 [Deltaproteobacteria bacterium]|nr:hypothetical protein [Deltaproteobacteria bacterium]
MAETEPRVACRRCGVMILLRTAQSNRGRCRGPCRLPQCLKCGNSVALARLEGHARTRCAGRQRRHVEERLRTGDLKRCPECGNAVRSFRLDRHLAEKCGARMHPFAAALPHVAVPEWLRGLADRDDLPIPIPLEHILGESCFYPSSGLDGSPILLANGCVHSFVYADYGTSRDAVLRAMSSPGFKHYRLLLQRDVARQELVPEHWNPTVSYWFDDPGAQGRLMTAQQSCEPFGVWSIWRRVDERNEKAGPLLFSFLFLGGEALACYDGLYRRVGVVPKVIALIQPGHAFGGNWTDFTDPVAPFWQAVTEQGAFPDYLLMGSYGYRRAERSQFEGYERLRGARTHDGGQDRTVDVFRRTRAT